MGSLRPKNYLTRKRQIGLRETEEREIGLSKAKERNRYKRSQKIKLAYGKQNRKNVLILSVATHGQDKL